jgi:hypothetical protein
MDCGMTPLFDLAAGAHFIVLDVEHDQVVTGDTVTSIGWYRWRCLCGDQPAARWSHRDLAERMASHHLRSTAATLAGTTPERTTTDAQALQRV